MKIVGTAAAAGQIALRLIGAKKKRGFDDGSGTLIIPDATIEEVHTDEMEITDHPVEQGTTISDHAFKRPAEVIITAGWSDSPNNSGISTTLVGAAANLSGAVRAVMNAAELASSAASVISGIGTGSPSAAAYAALLAMQSNRTLFTIFTGKRMYKNMLIKSLSTTTDAKTENSAIIRIGCRELLMAQSQSTMVPDSSLMASPEKNGMVVNMGTITPLPAPNINVASLIKYGIVKPT